MNDIRILLLTHLNISKYYHWPKITFEPDFIKTNESMIDVVA